MSAVMPVTYVVRVKMTTSCPGVCFFPRRSPAAPGAGTKLTFVSVAVVAVEPCCRRCTAHRGACAGKNPGGAWSTAAPPARRRHEECAGLPVLWWSREPGCRAVHDVDPGRGRGAARCCRSDDHRTRIRDRPDHGLARGRVDNAGQTPTWTRRHRSRRPSRRKASSHSTRTPSSSCAAHRMSGRG